MWGSGAGRWGRVSSLQFWAWPISIPYKGLFFSNCPIWCQVTKPTWATSSFGSPHTTPQGFSSRWLRTSPVICISHTLTHASLLK